MPESLSLTCTARCQAEARGVDAGLLAVVVEHAARRFRLPSGGTVCWVSRRGREAMYARGVSLGAAEETVGLRLTLKPGAGLVTRVEATAAVRQPVFPAPQDCNGKPNHFISEIVNIK